MRILHSILLSAAIQLALGAFTAHPYDMRVFITAGYSVAHGNSPYVPTDVSGTFGSTLFPKPFPGIGYPPPWGLLLGLSYLVSYNLFPNLILYNFAIKVPIIIANIFLALLVGRMVATQISDTAWAMSAVVFMLFNPYIIYTTAMWGQFDTLSVLLMLLAIFELTRGKWLLSGVALGAAIAFKLIPVVLLPLLFLHEGRRKGWSHAFQYVLCVAAVVLFSFVPFLFMWSIKPIIDNWSVHFVRIGAFSPMILLTPFGINESANELSFLGYLWVPALILIYCLIIRRPLARLPDLILAALALILGFTLTRSWVSEQNLNFVLPLVLLASVSRGWSRKWIAATWALPLIFTFFNSSPLGMLFLVVPQQVIDGMHMQLQLMLHVNMFQSPIASMARILTTICWLVIGLGLLHKCLFLRSGRPKKED